MSESGPHRLLSILGLGFGLAGRGGVHALLGAICTAELAAALPRTGGWTVYAERAFGRSGGLLVGWADWLAPCDRPDCWRQRRSSWGGSPWPCCSCSP